MTGARDFCTQETLRNGAAVTIRAARPDDRERIAQAFAKLDRESVYTRFFSYKRELSPAELGTLDTMDFVRDVLLVVTTSIDGRETVIAGARCIAHDEADGTLTAEVAFTVEEDYQSNGIAGSPSKVRRVPFTVSEIMGRSWVESEPGLGCRWRDDSEK